MDDQDITEATQLKRKTISSLVWKGLERGGSAVVQLIVQIIMARLLAPEEFGALAIMLVFINVGGVFVQSGLNTALIQAPEADEADFSTVFWLSLTISVILYFVVFFSAPTIAEFYGMSFISWPLRVLALILILNAYNSIQLAYVSRELKFRKVFFSSMASVLVSGVCGVACAIAGWGIWALVVQQLVYTAVTSVVLRIQITWRPHFVFLAHRAANHFSFGWKLLVSGLLNVAYQSLSDLIIGKQFSAADLGLVSQGKKYPQAIGTMLDGTIQPVMMSAVSRAQDDIHLVKRIVRRALKTSSFVIVPTMACFALVAEPLVLLLLGEKWLGCVPFMQMYCLTYALIPISTSNLEAINGMGRSDLFLKLEIIKKSYGLLFLLFAAFILHDVYWIVGCYVLSGLISTFVNAHPNKRIIGYSYSEQLRDIAPSFAIALVACALAFPLSLIGLHPIALVFLQCLVMLGVYFGISYAFHLEACTYLIQTAKEFFSEKNSVSD